MARRIADVWSTTTILVYPNFVVAGTPRNSRPLGNLRDSKIRCNRFQARGAPCYSPGTATSARYSRSTDRPIGRARISLR